MKNWEQGKIQIYTGNGKGKTTAALGAAVRALGAGLRVAIVYFDKGGTHYSERKILDRLSADGLPLEYVASGLDRIDPVTGVFRFKNTPEDVAEGKRGLEAAFDFMRRTPATDAPHSRPQVLILDEILNAVRLELVGLSDVLSLLDQKPADMELIMTGREVPPELEARADLITDMTLKKHYFYEGQKSREGIEW